MYHVELSHNFKTVLFSNGYERFLYRSEGYGEKANFVARRVRHLSKNFKILHYEEDLNQEGFFAICAKDFDKKIRLTHTHRKNLKLKQDWRLEAESIRFLSLHVKTKETEGNQAERETKIKMLTLDDNAFVISGFEVKEK